MFRLEDPIRGAWHDSRVGLCGGHSKDLDIENGCRVRVGGEPPGREVLAARNAMSLSSADSPFCRTWKPWQRKAWSNLREQSVAVTQFSRKIADHPTSL